MKIHLLISELFLRSEFLCPSGSALTIFHVYIHTLALECLSYNITQTQIMLFWLTVNMTPNQCVTRSLFQFSRREREFLSFNLMFETGTRISFFQSHVRDENENFFLPISCFETRTRISFFNLGLRDENENRD